MRLFLIFLVFSIPLVSYADDYSDSEKKVSAVELKEKSLLLPLLDDKFNDVLTKGEFIAAVDEILKFFEKELQRKISQIPTGGGSKSGDNKEILKEITDLKNEIELMRRKISEIKDTDIKNSEKYILERINEIKNQMNKEIDKLKESTKLEQKADNSGTILTIVVFGFLTIGRIIVLLI